MSPASENRRFERGDAVPRVVPSLALTLVLASATMLVAAKAHGRQVRLERELAGHNEVVFGGANAPFVEALWRRDRVRFWSVAPVAGVAVGAALWAWRGPAWALAAAPLGMLAGFVVAGLRSWLGLAREGGAGGRGSVAWWALVAAGACATTIAALV